LVLSFRKQLFRHIQRLSLAHHDMQGTANATYRIHVMRQPGMLPSGQPIKPAQGAFCAP
jgi:hypothetical protein